MLNFILVNRLSPYDVEVVAALGDSLTVGSEVSVYDVM